MEIKLATPHSHHFFMVEISPVLGLKSDLENDLEFPIKISEKVI